MKEQVEKRIASIPTRYKGCNFRSRLEARWATLFDELGIKWEYEFEGYDIKGKWYLPDFWLPEIGCFCEIKPVGQPDKNLYFDFPSITNRAIILLEGTPWDYNGWWFGFVGSYGCSEDNIKALRRCCLKPSSEKYPIGFIIESLEYDVRYYNTGWEPIVNNTILGSRFIIDGGIPMPWERIKIGSYNTTEGASNKARSARFEYRESGAT